MTTPWEEGDPSAKICILGEAPARTEIRQGRPLCGPSGKLLELCMHNGGVARRECYLTNVWEEEVIKAKTGDRITDKEGNTLWNKKGFTEIGIAKAQGAIRRIQDSKANVIVPLGGTALSFMFGDQRIMKWRGSILESSRFPGRKVVPTIHPAASLRGQYIYRYMIVNDLRRAKEESQTAEINLPQRHLVIDPSHEECLDWLRRANESERFATDIEVYHQQVSCFSIALSPTESISIPLYDGDMKRRWTEEQEIEIWLAYQQAMGNPDVMKINQNIIFDIGFLLRQNSIVTKGLLGDPMIAHHMIWPDFPKGLDFLCSVHTREPYYKDDGKLWKKPWRDPEAFWYYNAKDAACAFECWEVLEGELKNGYEKTYWETIELFEPLLYMMTRGISVDLGGLENAKRRVEKELAECEQKLAEVADYEFNPGSPKQCQEYFYGHKGIKPYISRKTSRPTTDDKAMSRIWRRYELPEAKVVQRIRFYRKLLGTYLEVGIDSDNRIRCSYNPRGTVTGRLSSSQTVMGTGMNLQNLHPDFKEFLVADDPDAWPQ